MTEVGGDASRSTAHHTKSPERGCMLQVSLYSWISLYPGLSDLYTNIEGVKLTISIMYLSIPLTL